MTTLRALRRWCGAWEIWKAYGAHIQHPRKPTPGSTLRKEADAIGRLVREKWAPGVAGSMEAA